MKKELELERELIYAEANNQKVRYFALLIKKGIIILGGNETMKERLKSPVVWCAMIVLIAEILKLSGVYSIPNDSLNLIQDCITIIVQGFATLNNPTDRKHF